MSEAPSPRPICKWMGQGWYDKNVEKMHELDTPPLCTEFSLTYIKDDLFDIKGRFDIDKIVVLVSYPQD